jgi:hypothetical protein
MSDDHTGDARPRPEYGEYASPEEQRAAIKQPAEWQLEAEQAAQAEQADAAPQQPVPGQYRPGAGPAPGAPFQGYGPQHPYQQPSAPAPGPAPAQRAGLGDRLVTFFLLAYGLYNVIDMIANATQGGALVRDSAQALDPADGHLLGSLPTWVWTAAAIAYSVVWLIALSSSMRAMRAGRIAFWIPLVAGIVAGLLVVALIVIAMGANPELLNDVPTPGGTGSPT